MASRRIRDAFTFFEKNVVNRMMKFGLGLGLAPKAFTLLETTGRRSGMKRQTPVGNGLVDDAFWLIAEHGEQADYVRNIRDDPRVRVKIGRTWRSGTATVMPDDDVAARMREILRHHGLLRRLDAALLRSSVNTLGTTPVTVRIDLDTQ